MLAGKRDPSGLVEVEDDEQQAWGLLEAELTAMEAGGEAEAARGAGRVGVAEFRRRLHEELHGVGLKEWEGR